MLSCPPPLNRYWPVIDDALRSVVYNKGITVRVMGSLWNHTGPDMVKFLRSLQSINNTGQFDGAKGILEVVRFIKNNVTML